MKVPNIIFDVGDVLLSYRWKQMMMDYGLSDEDAERLGADLFGDPDHLWSVFDTGTRTDESIIEEYCRKHPEHADVITFFIRHSEYMHVPRPKVWERVHALKQQGRKIYLLSNYPESFFKKHTQYADFMRDLDGAVVSYMIQAVKPDEAIYRTLLERYSLTPGECLFFDDRPENVATAVRLGMNAVCVRSQEELLAHLDALLNE